MKALLLKDFYVVAKHLALLLIIIPLLALITGGSMTPIIVFIGASLSMTSLAYDEQSKWNALSCMMPYSKFEVIFSKYVFGYLGVALGVVFSLLGIVVGGLLETNNTSNYNILIFISIAGALLYIAIIMPFSLKFGVEKGRYLFLIMMLLVAIAGTALNVIDAFLLTNWSVKFSVILLVGAIILNIISVWISMTMKKRKV